jgi:hypothetical protein
MPVSVCAPQALTARSMSWQQRQMLLKKAGLLRQTGRERPAHSQAIEAIF